MDKSKSIVVTPEMVNAGAAFVCEFFPAEWGGHKGISQQEALAVAKGVLERALQVSLSLRVSSAHEPHAKN